MSLKAMTYLATIYDEASIANIDWLPLPKDHVRLNWTTTRRARGRLGRDDDAVQWTDQCHRSHNLRANMYCWQIRDLRSSGQDVQLL